MNMKTITTFLTCLLLLFSSVSLSADNEKPTQQTTPIIIAVLTPGTVHGRSLSDMPQAYYMNGCINVSFNSTVDHSVIICVRNLSNGTQIQELINTSMMVVTIDVNEILSSGDFIIEFSYDNGDTYIGYFTL